MIVPSPLFLLFAAAAILIVNLTVMTGGRAVALLAINLVFIASFAQAPGAFAPLAGFLLLGYVAQHLCRDGSRPRLFAALLVLLIAAFFWLKRYSFVPAAMFLPFPYLLVGLSYVFFRVVHLVIDRHQSEIEGGVGGVSFLNYTLNFTSLTSGPIQRYEEYRRSETDLLPLNPRTIGDAIERIVIGYWKVAIVSAALAALQHRQIALLAPAQGVTDRVVGGALIAGIYPPFLYFNFSGYTDGVIGVARLLRIDLPENFDRPFSSENFIAFWSRWHITLSNWLKTYVYNPLMIAMMTRVPSPKLAPYLAVIAFFATFFLVGLWHGQTSEFLFFGVLQGGGVAANKLYQLLLPQWLGRERARALAAHSLYRIAARGLTFTWFAFTLLWFWSTWAAIGSFAATLGRGETVAAWLVLFVVASVALALLEAGRRRALEWQWSVDPGRREPVLRSRYVRTACATALLLVIVVLSVLLASPAPDVVYKTF